ncbi:hypothetical protein GW756_04695 [bacterium]|nr:hypothetical protein [bacterium]NCQ55679.1 hypothetical protein [Candidatus Parcubacteria bacterium]NCS67628.1 hypothetical protein [Candidatus Peregrinibacteria bacterium]NCS96642.1 hypothetical protein [bacterium]
MKSTLVFDVSGINSQGEEVFPAPEYFPEFFNLVGAMVEKHPQLVMAVLEALENDFESLGIQDDIFNVFNLPEDRDINEDGTPVDKPGDIVLLHDTDILINGIRLRVFFTIDPTLVGLRPEQILAVTDLVPPRRKH